MVEKGKETGDPITRALPLAVNGWAVGPHGLRPATGFAPNAWARFVE